MMIQEKEMVIKISPNNKKHYEYILKRNIVNGETIIVNQGDIPITSHAEVICKCEICKKEFTRKRRSIKSDITLCDPKCKKVFMSRNNPNPKKEKVKVSCFVCGKEHEVFESKFKKQNTFLCSRECYKKHRSINYSKDNCYNYQSFVVECDNCKNEFKTIQYDRENRNHLFCSPECYFEFRKNNYKEIYYTTYLNDTRKETIPEKLVRTYLDENDVDYIQEHEINKMYFVDFYLPKYKSIIEVYGDYWHGNKEVFPTLNDIQIKSIKRDKKRNGHLKHLGYDIFIIWEHELKENVDFNMGILIDRIINKHESATTTRQNPL